jgi:hypothetical protein
VWLNLLVGVHFVVHADAVPEVRARPSRLAPYHLAGVRVMEQATLLEELVGAGRVLGDAKTKVVHEAESHADVPVL